MEQQAQYEQQQKPPALRARAAHRLRTHSSSSSSSVDAPPPDTSAIADTRRVALSRRLYRMLSGRPRVVAACAVVGTCAGLYAAFDLSQMALDKAVVAKLGHTPGFEEHYRGMRRQWKEGAQTAVDGAAVVVEDLAHGRQQDKTDREKEVEVVTGIIDPEEMKKRDPTVSEDLLQLQARLKNLEETVFVKRGGYGQQQQQRRRMQKQQQ